MNVEDVKKILINELNLTEIIVKSEDNSHFQIIAIGDLFKEMSRVKKQQTVYKPLMDSIAANHIHAVSIKAYSPDEWSRERKLIGM